MARPIPAELTRTLWRLRQEGFRTSFQPVTKTFYWIDGKYFIDHREKIAEWCERTGCQLNSIHGFVKVDTGKQETYFRLQWAGKCYTQPRGLI